MLQGENHLGRNARFLLNLSFVAVLLRFDKLQAKERSTLPSMMNYVRVCIDPRDLNKELKRPKNPMGSVDEVANRLTGAKSFPWCMQWVLATSITYTSSLNTRPRTANFTTYPQRCSICLEENTTGGFCKLFCKLKYVITSAPVWAYFITAKKQSQVLMPVAQASVQWSYRRAY